jgi:hypothetical protein
MGYTMKPTFEDLSTFDWIYENVTPTRPSRGDGTVAIDHSIANEKLLSKMVSVLISKKV